MACETVGLTSSPSRIMTPSHAKIEEYFVGGAVAQRWAMISLTLYSSLPSTTRGGKYCGVGPRAGGLDMFFLNHTTFWMG
eukprot:440459-Rhodomonas_salina.1